MDRLALLGALAVVIGIAATFRTGGNVNAATWNGPIGAASRRLRSIAAPMIGRVRPSTPDRWEGLLEPGTLLPAALAEIDPHLPVRVFIVVSGHCGACASVIEWAENEPNHPELSPVRVVTRNALDDQRWDIDAVHPIVTPGLAELRIPTPSAILVDGDAKILDRTVGARADTVVRYWQRAMELAPANTID